MKGEMEDAISSLATGDDGIDHVVILRPGLIVGPRRNSDSRFAERMVHYIARFAGTISSSWLKDFWAQDVDVIARAAVRAGIRCANDERKEKVWILDQSDIVREGRLPKGIHGD